MAITPADSASSPSNYDAVTPHGRGPAPYDIQAPMEDLSGAVHAAGALAGAGVVYPMGPRQHEAEVMMESPQGFGSQGYDIDAGYSGGADKGLGGNGWPNDVEPTVAGP